MEESMHELSIALSIMDVIVQEAKKNEATWVKKAEIEVGKLAGVNIESLLFSLNIAKKQYGMEHSVIEIHQIEPEFECTHCNCTFSSMDRLSQCPNCQSYENRIIKGNELTIKSLLIKQ